MSPFDIVKKLFTQNDVPVNSPFMVNRILSFMPETFEFLTARLMDDSALT